MTTAIIKEEDQRSYIRFNLKDVWVMEVSEEGITFNQTDLKITVTKKNKDEISLIIGE